MITLVDGMVGVTVVDGGVGVTVLGGIAVVTMVDGIAVVTMVNGIAVVVVEVVVLMAHMSDELTALLLQLASIHSCLCRSIPSEHLDTEWHQAQLKPLFNSVHSSHELAVLHVSNGSNIIAMLSFRSVTLFCII